MADKPLPPQRAVEAQHDHDHPHTESEQAHRAEAHDSGPADDPSASGDPSAGGDWPLAVDPTEGVSGLDGSDPLSGIDPSSFLGPIQEIGSKVGELPSQLGQGLQPAMQAAQALPSMASALAQPAGNGLAGAGSPAGGDKVQLDPEKAHATTSRAEQESASGLAKKSAPQGLAGKTPFDGAVVTGAVEQEVIDFAGSGQLGVRSVSNSASRRIGTATIEAADDKAAAEQASVRYI